MFRIGAVSVGPMSAWQAVQNSRARRAQLSSDMAVTAAISSAFYGAQQNQFSGLASIAVTRAMARIQAEQQSKVNSMLSQVGNTLHQSTSSSSSSAVSALNLVA